jgi:hypothetical protein
LATLNLKETSLSQEVATLSLNLKHSTSAKSLNRQSYQLKLSWMNTKCFQWKERGKKSPKLKLFFAVLTRCSPSIPDLNSLIHWILLPSPQQ